jgi:DNA helicase HerA-like ATPase
MNSLDHSLCVPLINRIQDILESEELAGIFRPPDVPSVFDAIARFFEDPKVPVLRISMEFLPTTHRVREIVSNSLARVMLAAGRTSTFRSKPLVMIVDEAHQCMSNRISDMSLEYPLEAFNIIAKEGRKYGLTLCLATQRPRDIPDDVLSQVGTFLVHRLVSDADRSSVERASGAMSRSMLDNLPSLAPGEGFIIGIDFPTALHVRMIRPTREPHSHGPDFQRLW